MGAETDSPADAEEIDDVTKAIVERHIELFFALMRADIANTSVMDGVPNRASLALLPDDDPEVAEYALQAGVAGVKRGKNVYFLHITHDADGTLAIKWPEDTLPPLSRDEE